MTEIIIKLIQNDNVWWKLEQNVLREFSKGRFEFRGLFVGQIFYSITKLDTSHPILE